MSFKSTLNIEGRIINILYCEYDFRRQVNKDYYPVTYPQSGFVTLQLEAQRDDFFESWCISPTQLKSGSIIFYKRDNMSKMKELVMTDVYCVYFREKFSSLGTHPFFIEVKLSAGSLRYGQSEYKNPWFNSEGRGSGDKEELTTSIFRKNLEPDQKLSSPFIIDPLIGIDNGGMINDLTEAVQSILPAIADSFDNITQSVDNVITETKGPVKDWWKDVTNDAIQDPTKLEQIKCALEDQKMLLTEKKKKLERWSPEDQACFKKVFGRASDKDKSLIAGRIDKQLSEVDNFLKDDLYKEKFFESGKDNVFAHVYGSDSDHEIYLDKSFWKAPAKGYNSKAGTLVHEMSHFKDLGDTDDVVFGGKKMYGKEWCIKLASDPMNANLALKNADSFEYYIEESICQ